MHKLIKYCSRFLRIKIREILAYDLRAKSKILAGQQMTLCSIDWIDNLDYSIQSIEFNYFCAFITGLGAADFIVIPANIP